MRAPFTVQDGIECYAPALADAETQFPQESFDQLFRLEADSFWFQSRNVVLKSLFKRFLGVRPLEFLEIGCGTGFVLNAIQRMGFRAAGADLFVNALRYARQRVPEGRFYQLDVRDMPFAGDFDAVGAFDVIEHIDDDRAVMASVHRALRPDGLFFISVPQYQMLWSQYDELGQHKRRYSRRDLLDKLRASGFCIDYCGSFVFAMFPVLLATRLLARLRPAPASAVDSVERELKFPWWQEKIARFLMRIDEFLIARGFQLPFGGSLLVVARKR